MLLCEVIDRDTGHALAVFAHRDEAIRLCAEPRATATEGLEVNAVDDYGRRFPRLIGRSEQRSVPRALRRA